MKCTRIPRSCGAAVPVLMGVLCFGLPILVSAQVPVAQEDATRVGAKKIIVHGHFHGSIFGFDIDQNGTEGVLSEAKNLPNGNVLAAVETFDQATGKILNVVAETKTQDDFVTRGIVGTSVGLVEHQVVTGFYVTQRIYEELNPVDANAFTGTWSAPLTSDDIILGVSRSQGTSTTAVLYFQNSGNSPTFVLGSNVAANTFGPTIQLTDQVFCFCLSPVMAYDSQTNQAVIASSTGAVGGPAPEIALANLTTGKVTQFTGVWEPPFGPGSVNGIAVDSEDGIAVTSTELEGNITFYDLKNRTGFLVALPQAGQLTSGSDVEFDPIHKLFFVAQQVSGTAKGSSIQVYDTNGNLVESLNGFNFSNDSSVIFTHIALNPSNRTGYVDGPDPGGLQASALQAFTY